MTQAAIGGRKPILAALKARQYYYWCACGLSANQPWCDGSHSAGNFLPLVWQPAHDQEVLLCTCKRTATPPYCDGSHNQLDAVYGSGELNDEAVLVDYQPLNERLTKAVLDGGCYVMRPSEQKAFTRRPGAFDS